MNILFALLTPHLRVPASGARVDDVCCMGVLGMDRTDGICGVPMLVMPPTGSRVVIANAAQLHIGH